jgi:beta-glucosidase
VGVRQSVPATCFPTASALASSWNRELVYRVGEAIGKECLQEKVSVVLGPGANIKRSPLCGRNFEYFSEDPYLSGEMATSHILGVQSQGVGASLKHFVANNQEKRRMTIDAVVDERALREIYLAGFEIAVRQAQPWTVMSAYNRVNGAYCSEGQQLLTQTLREAWGFEGVVVTDWGAMDRRVAGLAAGTDLEMPRLPNGNDAAIVAAIENGELPEEILDQAVARLLRMILAAEARADGYRYDVQAHHALARRAASEGAVLLKNDDAILPLTPNVRVALIGQFARSPRYQGAGSSLMNPTKLDNLHDEMVKLVGRDCLVYAPGYPKNADEIDDDLIQEAIAAAQAADVALVCAGLLDRHEVEGLDRQHMRLPASHDALIEAVAAANPNTVVILSNGAPVEMPWIDRVKAVLEGYLGGQAGAGGIADIVYGEVNPSGKLAETFPIRLEDTPSYYNFPGGPKTVEYRESVYVGYRYYDTAQREVLFPFGHGLSYTTFAYHDLILDEGTMAAGDPLQVTVVVQNTGTVAGQEIVQLYVRDVESTVFRPDKELKAFAKVALQPGEARQVTFDLGRRAFAYYDTVLGDWHVEPGDFELLVGASSRDIRLRATVHLDSEEGGASSVDRTGLAAYYDLRREVPISQESFEALLGRPVPSNHRARGEPYTLNTPISDMNRSLAGRLLAGYVGRQIKATAPNKDSANALMRQAVAEDAPLRFLLMRGKGTVSQEMLDALLMLINGRLLKGAMALLRARRGRKE